jgi:hypothetical protein
VRFDLGAKALGVSALCGIKKQGRPGSNAAGSVWPFNLISSSELAVAQLASVQPSGKAVEDTIPERNHQ